jgi:hypothetical protein
LAGGLSEYDSFLDFKSEKKSGIAGRCRFADGPENYLHQLASDRLIDAGSNELIGRYMVVDRPEHYCTNKG